MSDLLNTVIEPHGGLDRWNQLDAVSVHGANGGVLRAAGGSGAGHYISDYTNVAGIMVPTRRRIFPRGPGDEALGEPLLVSIDVSDIELT